MYPYRSGSTGDYTLKPAVHSFTLARATEVSVALTGMTIDFDCRVGSSRCTNNWRTEDDSWKGRLAGGTYSVEVYPYERGPGNYSLKVTSTETLAYVATPMKAIGRICTTPAGGEETCQTIYGDLTAVLGPDPGPPIGAGPGHANPSPTPPPNPGPNPPPTTTTPTPSFEALGTLADGIDCRGWNIDAGDRFRAPRPGGTHSGLDIQTNGPGAFRAPAAGTVSRPSFPGQLLRMAIHEVDAGERELLRLLPRLHHSSYDHR